MILSDWLFLKHPHERDICIYNYYIKTNITI